MSTVKYIFLIYFNSFVMFSLMGQKGTYYEMPIDMGSEDYVHNTVIFKVRPEFRRLCEINSVADSELQNIFSYLRTIKLSKIFPNHLPPSEHFNEYRFAYADLSMIYELNYISDIPIQKVLFLLQSTGKLEYAVPRIIYKPLFVPNDPNRHLQYFLKNIKAYEAWDITQGDTNVVIGIVDTGTDFAHLDLTGNLKYNYADPIDGIDNDNDGFVDNFRGWDIGENDNNPHVTNIGHGSAICGTAAASTNNNIGIAGVGFKCKFLPVKIDDNKGQLVKGYEGIVYAADHGCQIINCSWGGKFGQGPFGEDVITYATINKNALVVAACGNDNNENIFYPAAVKYVISVAGTDSLDVKWQGSTFGKDIDICAPGTIIHTTYVSNTYVTSSGTSLASPMVAGAAALLKSYRPNLNALQLGEKLKSSSDMIDTIAGNLAYAKKLGSGRLNILKALTDTLTPSVDISDFTISDYKPGLNPDTLDIWCTFTNYLAPTYSLQVTITTNSPFITVIPMTLNLGSLNTMQSINNQSTPFKAVILPGIPSNQKVEFIFSITDTNYLSSKIFTHIFKKDFIDISNSYISTTLTSNSKIGYNSSFYNEGLGFRYLQSNSIVSIAGLLVGTSSGKVSDNTFGDSGYKFDFLKTQSIAQITSPKIANHEYFTTYNDDGAGVLKQNISVKQKSYFWDSLQNAKSIIHEYIIKNNWNLPLSNLYAGLYVDWELPYFHKNRADFDASKKTAFVYSTLGGTYTGIKMLSAGSVLCYSFDNDGSNNSINLNDGFSSFEKYESLKGNRNTAGFHTSEGTDVSQIISTGPYTLNPGDSIKVVYALIVGDHLFDLHHSGKSAYDTYYNILKAKENEKNNHGLFGTCYPNPVENETILSFFNPSNSEVLIEVKNILGKTFYSLSKKRYNAGNHNVNIDFSNYASGIYFVQISTEKDIHTFKVVKK